MLISQIAARDNGYAPPPATEPAPKLPLDTIVKHLSATGLTLLGTEVVAQHSTMAEKKAWLSIPVFARPDGDFTHAQLARGGRAATQGTMLTTPPSTSSRGTGGLARPQT